MTIPVLDAVGATTSTPPLPPGILPVRASLARIVQGQDLSADEMSVVVGQLLDGSGSSVQIAALLTALRMKGETVEELVGAALAMRERMQTVRGVTGPVLDTCGTGGDGSGSVNVTTLASFVIAAAGVRVAKHGNRAQSSRAGSHDVLEALGIDPAPGPELAARSLAQLGLCFLFAPRYHALTQALAAPRRELGFRTLFNLLGPLTNPAQVRLHLNGVFARDRCRFLAEAHARLGAERALVVHGSLGLDEFAPCGVTHVAELRASGEIIEWDVTPAHFGLPESNPTELIGGDAKRNAALLCEALEGARGALRTSALMTAAAGLYVAGRVDSLGDGVELAALAIDRGKAASLLGGLRRVTPLNAGA
jgi:anthranilate phosphoribosyltransferase